MNRFRSSTIAEIRFLLHLFSLFCRNKSNSTQKHNWERAAIFFFFFSFLIRLVEFSAGPIWMHFLCYTSFFFYFIFYFVVLLLKLAESLSSARVDFIVAGWKSVTIIKRRAQESKEKSKPEQHREWRHFTVALLMIIMMTLHSYTRLKSTQTLGWERERNFHL